MLYLTTQLGFIILTMLFFYLLIKSFADTLLKTTLSTSHQKKIINTFIFVIALWATITSAYSLLGVMSNFKLFPLNIVPVIVAPFLAITVFTFSKTLKEILIHLHPTQLIRLQVFRVFVEILLWMLFIQNLLPVQMTFEGRNFDILTGITAPIITYLYYQNKISNTALIFWNLICLGLLINIVMVSILSMPTPFQYFQNEPSNTIVTQFAIHLLPTFLVPLAYMLHFFSLRQLLLKRQ